MRAYTSCNCASCRHYSPPGIRREHKRYAHRLLRRLVRLALRDVERDADPVVPQSVSTGYKY